MKDVELKTDKGYYLGRNKDGARVYLQYPSWDCDWYWGFGYLKVYNKYCHTCSEFSHFNYKFFKKDMCAWDTYHNYFKKSNLDNKKIWKLLELMKSFYTLKSYAEIMYIGGSHFTTIEDFSLKNEKEWERINKEVIPSIFKEIDKLFD